MHTLRCSPCTAGIHKLPTSPPASVHVTLLISNILTPHHSIHTNQTKPAINPAPKNVPDISARSTPRIIRRGGSLRSSPTHTQTIRLLIPPHDQQPQKHPAAISSAEEAQEVTRGRSLDAGKSSLATTASSLDGPSKGGRCCLRRCCRC